MTNPDLELTLLRVSSLLHLNKIKIWKERGDFMTNRINNNYVLKNTCKTAFTLAEVLITLGIIGVVAALTLPSVIVNINERRNTEREVNIAQKITQAMEHMRATGTLVQYNSTEDFINEFKKHIKINKICDKDHLIQCWPTDKVIDKQGKEFDVSKAKTGKWLNLDTETNNVGLVLTDGAVLILNYDPSKPGYDVGDKIATHKRDFPVGGNKTKEYTYTSDVTNAIAYVTDVNGTGKPNRETDKNSGKNFDIRSFNDASFTKGLDCYDGTAGCVYVFDTTPSPINCTNSTTAGDDYKYCNWNNLPSGYSTDYWAGAVKACDKKSLSLPEVGVLSNIQKAKTSYPALKTKTNWFWSVTKGNSSPQYTARRIYFDDGYTSNNYKDVAGGVLCVGN